MLTLMTQKRAKKLYLFHDIDPLKYFDPLFLAGTSGGYVVVPLYVSPLRKMVSCLHKRRLTSTVLRRVLWSVVSQIRLAMVSDPNSCVVVGMGPYNCAAFKFALIARRQGVIYHTSWPRWHRAREAPFRCKLVSLSTAQRAWRKMMSRVKRVVAVTEAAALSIGSAYPVPTKVTVIPHGIELPTRTNGIRKSQAPTCVFVGRAVPEKGLKLVMELARRMPQCTFALVGVQRSDLTNEQAVPNNAIMHGWISKRTVFSIMAESKFLLAPSLKTPSWEELFGLVVIEAMGRGTIPIATTHVGPRSIITNRVDGFVLTEDEYVERASIIIGELLENENKRQAIATRALATSRKYDSVVLARKWRSVIEWHP